MNPQFGSALMAIPLTGTRSNCFEIVAGTQTTVPPMMVGTCLVTSAGCNFNPTVFEVSPVGGITELRVSGDNGGGTPVTALVAAIGAIAVAASALWYADRRRA
jgi:hypothetical protein